MKTPQDGGPAFPQHGWTNNPEVLERMKDKCGMSMRDWFAGMALQGICSNLHCSPSVTFKEVAARAFQQADAMLKAREDGKP